MIGLPRITEARRQIRRPHKQVDPRHPHQFVQPLHRGRSLNLRHQTKIAIYTLLSILHAFQNPVLHCSRHAEIPSPAVRREPRILPHLFHLFRSIHHRHIDDVRPALCRLEHVLSPRIGNPDHRQHSCSSRHSTQICRLRKRNRRMFHLNPYRLIAQMRRDLQKNRIVKEHRRPHQRPAAICPNRPLQPIHRTSPIIVSTSNRLPVVSQSHTVGPLVPSAGTHKLATQPTANKSTLPTAPIVYSLHE